MRNRLDSSSISDEDKIHIPLEPHQEEFVTFLDKRFIGLVAGYGAGKTFSFIVKGLYLAWLNADPYDRKTGALLEPTNAMAADILIPDMKDIMDACNIPYKYTASPLPRFTIHFRQGDFHILIRSAENYRRLAGLNLCFFGVDEADTIKKEVAEPMWRLLASRLRTKGAILQGFTASTPEGFNFLYDFFVKEIRLKPDKAKNRHILHASSYDNPNLDETFIESLLEIYSEELIQGYLYGQFTNLKQGNVYYGFSRKENGTDATIDTFDDIYNHYYHPVHIGLDFNIGKCCGIVHALDDVEDIYVVDELTGILNTEAMIDEIYNRYAGRDIYIYPDASSANQSTNSSTTDLKMLENAGFKVRAKESNPLVRDRVNSMNGRIRNAKGKRHYYVNIDKAPVLTESLETQTYNDKGEPDKTRDQDHPNDATGYFVWYMFPIQRTRKHNLRLQGAY